MPSIVDQTLFSDPSGRLFGLVYLSGALLLSGSYGYYVAVTDFTPNRFALVMSVGMALSGIAESLPKDRRREAGFLRLASIAVLMSLLVVITTAPGLLSG